MLDKDPASIIFDDTRNPDYFNLYNPEGQYPTIPGGSPVYGHYIPAKQYGLLRWAMYKYYASQAMADVIKANFNPNLHLNELNPNASLYTMVDKTDLIKNSTEFCFLSTGYFEIESVGRVLRAEWEPDRFHISPYLIINKDSFQENNQVMGQRRLKVGVKLWDLYRETVQGDFAKGSYSRNKSQYHTNLNLACESGPEVNNGSAPLENRYEGYLQLATHGGFMGFAERWIKGRLYRTSDFKTHSSLEEEGFSESVCPGM
jgi:hypothetical protein